MDLDAATLRRMLELGSRAKRGEVGGRPLAGKHVAMIFEKPSNFPGRPWEDFLRGA
jgi:ornithine carbamoyltransferase